MKTCTKCKVDQEKTMFCRDASRVDGLHPWCRSCRSSVGKTYTARNTERRREWTAKWRRENPEASKAINRACHHRLKEKRNAYCREYRAANLEKMRHLGREWAKNNPEKARAINANRRSAKMRATPIWANDEFDSFVMKESYALAIMRAKATGIDWHVDHIVPLRSKRVCGLHCAANVQVIPADINHRKGNRVWPDM